MSSSIGIRPEVERQEIGLRLKPTGTPPLLREQTELQGLVVCILGPQQNSSGVLHITNVTAAVDGCRHLVMFSNVQLPTNIIILAARSYEITLSPATNE